MPCILGLDVGSVAASYVLLDGHQKVVDFGYSFHNGDPSGCLASLLKNGGLPKAAPCAVTTSSPGFIRRAERYDDTICLVHAATAHYPDIRSLLVIGGERFGLIAFDESGEYRRMKTNSSCAAGTGSFLDQQARRLNLPAGEALANLAQSNSGDLPVIASRCSVFAKTDIIHAQQEGYSPAEICDGICYGLARNVADVLFDDRKVKTPAVFTGGVARNEGVRRHLNSYLGTEFIVDEYSHVYGAYGAAIALGNSIRDGFSGEEIPISGIVEQVVEQKELFFKPLTLSQSSFPDFGAHDSYLFEPVADWRDPSDRGNPVEVDAYINPEDADGDIILGFDIGSTSTKAAVCDNSGKVFGGFYTRTAGRPIVAVQALLESIDRWLGDGKDRPKISGAATTGSGRKLVGRVIGADLILDEISAHARAAYELNSEIDTIIEIGGQDSKFTSLKNGSVVFSKMNTVCAAGTGSFLEEQAARLGVAISDFADLAGGSGAPLTSDRCTVFMERDINCFLGRNYTNSEILAAAAHSVCENYLLKVASEAHIGEVVTFQGATAKNRALVAAFEQKLGKDLLVSRYCHLTGALGAALSLLDQPVLDTGIRGLEMYKNTIPVDRERCTYCANHCRLTVAQVGEEKIAYGFLCGRDYEGTRFVSTNKSGFGMLKEIRRIEKAAFSVDNEPAYGTVIGIPAALHLLADIGFWTLFFSKLGYQTTVSDDSSDAVKKGKLLAGAEFCAPMAAFHGHTRQISTNATAIFLPTYLEDIHPVYGKETPLRKLCYYTQFAPGLVTAIAEESGANVIAPVLDPRRGKTRMLKSLHKSLQSNLEKALSLEAVVTAFEAAESARETSRSELRGLFADREARDVDVALLGRPYVLRSTHMNKGIPEVFASLGIRTFAEEMLPVDIGRTGQTSTPDLTDEFHWVYATRLLEAAEYCAATPGLYPVLLTSFKCAPDSFLIEYFCRVLDGRGKPYLILQLDEHESSVGYETRIEAAVRSFKNHFDEAGSVQLDGGTTEAPKIARSLGGKTVLLPNWDPLASPLVAANLRWAGFDVRLLEEDNQLIRESMKYNTGQCIPVHIILHEFARYIKNHDLEPEKTVLWTPDSEWSCNIPLYPMYIKSMLEKMGDGLEKASVYKGKILHAEISSPIAMRGYFAYLFSGLIRRMICRIRPYEVNDGETDRRAEESLRLSENAFLGAADLSGSLEAVVDMFEGIPVRSDTEIRPKVAIFGDLYVRDNDILNQGLIRHLEKSGAEVVTTPYSDYLRIISSAYFRKWFAGHEFKNLFKFRSMLAVVDIIERRYRKLFPDFVRKESAGRSRNIEEKLAKFNISVHHEGESYENILKILHLVETHPDISLFVQANPAFCCPSLVTEAMAGEIERVTGVPVVSVTYDGTETWRNDVVVPYVHFAKERLKSSRIPV